MTYAQALAWIDENVIVPLGRDAALSESATSFVADAYGKEIAQVVDDAIRERRVGRVIRSVAEVRRAGVR